MTFYVTDAMGKAVCDATVVLVGETDADGTRLVVEQTAGDARCPHVWRRPNRFLLAEGDAGGVFLPVTSLRVTWMGGTVTQTLEDDGAFADAVFACDGKAREVVVRFP